MLSHSSGEFQKWEKGKQTQDNLYIQQEASIERAKLLKDSKKSEGKS